MASSVLVVDDDATFRLFARQALTSWGHVVVGEAGSVAEALQRTSELRPDTVLADVGLPDGDGFDLARELRALPHPPRVVLISSDDNVANGSAARRVGAVGFVAKDELRGPLMERLIAGDQGPG